MRMNVFVKSRASELVCLTALCGLVSAVAGGCGQSAASDAPIGKLTPVKGQAAFLDKPIPNAVVTFHPAVGADKKAKTPFAVVKDDGSFVLTTYQPEDGVPAGEYAVTVSWFKPAKGTSVDDGIGEELLPVKYQRPESSGLKATINEGSADPVILKLTR